MLTSLYSYQAFFLATLFLLFAFLASSSSSSSSKLARAQQIDLPKLDMTTIEPLRMREDTSMPISLDENPADTSDPVSEESADIAPPPETDARTYDENREKEMYDPAQDPSSGNYEQETSDEDDDVTSGAEW